ncbi:serine hydrolase domain-containing protein [Actinomadura verrucosospora]
MAKLAAKGRFSGRVLLAHRGRTVLSRSYGMADQEKGIRNHEGTAFTLSSAGKPFFAVALLQLAQRGRLRLTDTVGDHLTGFAADVAEKVNIHDLLSGTSGLDAPDEDVDRVFQSRDEVHRYYEGRARQARLVGVPGTPNTAHAEPEVTISALIVEAVAGMTYWDYVHPSVVTRTPAGQRGSEQRRGRRFVADGGGTARTGGAAAVLLGGPGRVDDGRERFGRLVASDPWPGLVCVHVEPREQRLIQDATSTSTRQPVQLFRLREQL